MTDTGDYRTATLQVTPYGGDTAAVLTVVDPDGTETTPLVSASDDDPTVGTQTWTAAAYELDQPGEWVERWVVTGTGASAQRAIILVAPDPAAALSGIRVYATTGDYALHLHAAPPAGARRALAEASRDVDDMLTTAVYDVDATTGLPTDADVIVALRDATCLQADYRRGLGDPSGVDAGRIVAARIGSVQVTKSGTPGGQGTPGKWSSKAWRRLQEAGLVGYGPWSW